MNIEYYPVFSMIIISWGEDYTQYIVKVDEDVSPLLFSGVYSRCYGYELNRIL